jgi:hypothetical protein
MKQGEFLMIGTHILYEDFQIQGGALDYYTLAR